MNDYMYIRLNENQIKSLVNFIEVELLDSIRRDEYFDNIDYVVNISTALVEMRNELNKFKENASQEAKDEDFC